MTTKTTYFDEERAVMPVEGTPLVCAHCGSPDLNLVELVRTPAVWWRDAHGSFSHTVDHKYDAFQTSHLPVHCGKCGRSGIERDMLADAAVG